MLVVSRIPISFHGWEQRGLEVCNRAGYRLPIDEFRVAAVAIGTQSALLSLETDRYDIPVSVPMLNGWILGDVDRSHYGG